VENCQERLLLKNYKPDDSVKRATFCDELAERISIEGDFLPNVIFIDDATFHLSGTVNHHNVRVWGLENPREITEPARGSPEVNVFCTLSVNKVYGLLFVEHSITNTA
jgi:hypothetical protein